jgi:tRNA threonylcarbamoyladenosine modification (KEOPS) complex  Pcc1 subunit
MKAKCSLEIDFESENDVKKIVKAVSVDDFDFVKTKISGRKLTAELKSNSVSSLLHTLDDYLACVSVASKIVDKD